MENHERAGKWANVTHVADFVVKQKQTSSPRAAVCQRKSAAVLNLKTVSRFDCRAEFEQSVSVSDEATTSSSKVQRYSSSASH